jgi:uncharacterized protein YndB with AHSA1/START domain
MGESALSELRSIVLQIEIAARPAAVWRALTEAAELTRWFPPEAEVRPGTKGSIRLSWGDPIVAHWQIDDWSPESRLYVLEIRPLGILLAPREGGAVMRSVDFRLEARSEATVLHLRHAGFGCGPDWEEACAAVRRGWEFQLHSLRHYLERHPGTERAIARLRRTLRLPAEEVWARLVGSDGLFANRSGEPVEEGCRCVLRGGSGEVCQGDVRIFDPPRQLAVTLSDINAALFRIYMVKNAAGAVELSLWLACYGVPPAVVQTCELRWASLLDGLYPPAEEACGFPGDASEPSAGKPEKVIVRGVAPAARRPAVFVRARKRP